MPPPKTLMISVFFSATHTQNCGAFSSSAASSCWSHLRIIRFLCGSLRHSVSPQTLGVARRSRRASASHSGLGGCAMRSPSVSAALCGHRVCRRRYAITECVGGAIRSRRRRYAVTDRVGGVPQISECPCGARRDSAGARRDSMCPCCARQWVSSKHKARKKDQGGCLHPSSIKVGHMQMIYNL